MNKPVNLASLPKDDALARARIAGRSIFGDVNTVTHVYHDLMSYWIGRNLPQAVGQSDDEFGDLVEEVEKEFNAGVDEAVVAAQKGEKSPALLERVDQLATGDCVLAWKIYNVVAFMIEALPDDGRDDLPVKCTLIDLHGDLHRLGERLMDFVHRVKHG